jgi:hypothetical protein
VIDLFSKRQKRKRGDYPDVYSYDKIPKNLRVQVVHILNDAFGDGGSRYVQKLYEELHDLIAREYGVFTLSDEAGAYNPNYQKALYDFFLETDDHEKALDVIEISFRLRKNLEGDHSFESKASPNISANGAISELNDRFRENGVGYQFEEGSIIRVDSQYVHSEVVKPTLALLREQRFKGVNDEFLKAHEHYREGRFKECLNECLKSFESTLKTICDDQEWDYDENDTASKLIQICFDNDLIPSHLQSHFSALRASLESGIPTVRNKHSGHGQGKSVKPVPRYLAGYLLHLTATTILFLADAEHELNPNT